MHVDVTSRGRLGDAEPIRRAPTEWTRRTVLRQRWDELAYFHWPYDPEVVQRLLPDGLRVDTIDGRAWVGLIPFEMRSVRLGPSPVVPYLGHFIEINVRTYVVDGLGRRGVWFFSLDVPRSLIVAVARTAFALPYCWSDAGHTTDGDRHVYTMRRRWPRDADAAARMSFRVGERLPDRDVDELDDFLTARWSLMTRRGNHLEYGPVHHPPWPLHAVHDVEIDESVIVAAGLPAPEGAPHARYSPGTPVQIGWLERIPGTRGTR